MKKLKLSSSSQPSLETPISSKDFRKKPLFRPNIKPFYLHQPELDIAQLCIKNPHFFRINFQNNSLHPSAYKIIKRNLKYLKGTKYYKFNSTPSFYMWKLANQLEKPSSKGYLDKSKSCSLVSSAENPPKFLQKLERNYLISKALNMNLTSLDSTLQKTKFTKQLQKIRILSLSTVLFLKSLLSGPEYFDFLQNLGLFRNLQSLNLDFQVHQCKPDMLYDLFETLNEANVSSNLTSLKISMKFDEMDKKVENLKKIIAKFTKLKCLCLNFNFHDNLKDCGRIFTSLASFKILKYLNLDIHTYWNFDHAEVMKFIFAHKNLETLKLKVRLMMFHEYAELFEGLKNLKSLVNLSIFQVSEYSVSFAYGVVFKALEALKKLKSFKMSLGRYIFDQKELNAIWKHLLKHSSIEKVDILIPLSHCTENCYHFDDEFYGNIKKLRDKLLSFKVRFILNHRLESERAYEAVSKIINPTGILNKNFASYSKKPLFY